MSGRGSVRVNQVASLVSLHEINMRAAQQHDLEEDDDDPERGPRIRIRSARHSLAPLNN